MELVDSRRLTGANILWKRPGADSNVSYARQNDEEDPLISSQAERQINSVVDDTLSDRREDPIIKKGSKLSQVRYVCSC